MEFLTFTATENDSGRRVDKIIRRLFPKIPLSSIYKYIRKGLIRLNERRCHAEDIVSTRDTIQVASFLVTTSAKSGELSTDAKPALAERKPRLQLEDIFRNEFLRVINKPYDVPVHGGGNASYTLADAVSDSYCIEHGEPSLSFNPGPLHRLDRKTTGILVFSQNLAGARWFSSAINNHFIQKTYLALVQGYLESPAIWTERIARATQSGRASQSGFHLSECNVDLGKEAETLATPVEHGSYHGKPVTLVQLAITTGRTHQIRLHCACHGHPLLGDTAYGGEKITESQDFFLHAWHLAVPDQNPVGLPSNIEAPLPLNFKNMLEKCLSNFNAKSYNKKEL